MNHNNYLARNLESYRILNHLSMRRFAIKAGIPLSTLRTIMKEGNTTMDTVLRISNNLNISLDALVGSANPDFELPANRNCIKNADCWLGDFSSEKGTEIFDLIAEIWSVIDK